MTGRESTTGARHWPIIGLMALVWATLIVLAVFFHLRSLGWPVDQGMLMALWPFAPGGFIGGAYGVWAANSWGTGKRPSVRFSLFFVVVGVSTGAMVALLYYLQFRSYFAQWHGEFLSAEWAFQTFFTGLSTIYLFLSTALHPFVPWIVIVLGIASLAFSRGWLPGCR